MHRHADRARLVGERTRDGLANPPGRVRRELVALAPVELLGGAHEADRPLLDQVEERQSLVAVALRDRDDEAQVRLDHLLLRPMVAALDALRELDLLRRRQQVDLADVLQEELQRVGGELDIRLLLLELLRARRVEVGLSVCLERLSRRLLLRRPRDLSSASNSSVAISPPACRMTRNCRSGTGRTASAARLIRSCGWSHRRQDAARTRLLPSRTSSVGPSPTPPELLHRLVPCPVHASSRPRWKRTVWLFGKRVDERAEAARTTPRGCPRRSARQPPRPAPSVVRDAASPPSRRASRRSAGGRRAAGPAPARGARRCREYWKMRIAVLLEELRVQDVVGFDLVVGVVARLLRRGERLRRPRRRSRRR